MGENVEKTEVIPDDILMHACCGEECQAAISDRDGICERWAHQSEAASMMECAGVIAMKAISAAMMKAAN